MDRLRYSSIFDATWKVAQKYATTSSGYSLNYEGIGHIEERFGLSETDLVQSDCFYIDEKCFLTDPTSNVG